MKHFFEVLFLIFLVLKLVGVISWSWWLVTLPITGPFVLALILFIALCFGQGSVYNDKGFKL